MADVLSYKEIVQDDVLLNEFEPIDQFQIIIRGGVSFYQRNPAIVNWEWAQELLK